MSAVRATVVTGISELVTNVATGERGDDGLLGVIRDAAMVVSRRGDDAPVVEWIGHADQVSAGDDRIDLGGRAVIPGFVDCHTHLVFAGDRSTEFAARMAGTAYDGGGIGVTVGATRAASDEQLRVLLQARVRECRRQGTTELEVKTGYGLDVATEVRLARLAGEVTPHVTFLGAHVVPPEYADDRASYVDLVCGDMLDALVPVDGPRLVTAIDVFCEPASEHAFTGDESRQVLQAGARRGLTLRVHGNQLADGPGVQLACELGAANVDHCTHLTDADVEALAATKGATVATLLPGVEFSTRSPYPSGRRLLDAGVTVALATDCNPGTCYSSSMPFMIALAVRDMGMTPAEALWAATRGGALALRSTGGVLQAGGRADLAVVDAPSHLHLTYRPGVPLVRPLDWSAAG